MTAHEAWQARPVVEIDCVMLRKEVEVSCSRLVAGGVVKQDLGWRIAVERALTKRGLLRVVPGGGC